MTVSPEVVTVDLSDSIATITLNRPESRNAINPQMRRRLWEVLAEAEDDASVAVMILTGADPAFCAGLDLKQMGTDRTAVLGGAKPADRRESSAPFPERTKPLIGAINGAAITGGFELALNCDFLIASEHARFADTHARVGVMPGWGLTPLLADAVGVRRAREISLTGNFVTAAEALTWGLVNRVVPHHELPATARAIAEAIAGNDQVGVRRMLATYAEQEHDRLDASWALEGAAARVFGADVVPGADIDNRRDAIMARGREQL